MPSIKPFNGIRPAPGLENRVALRAEDASSPERSRAIAESEPLSFIHVSKGEADITEFLAKGYVLSDEERSVYIYRMTEGSHSQTGLICLAETSDYEAGSIKKHELVRREKLEYQTEQIARLGGNSEPVVLSFEPAEGTEGLLNIWADGHPCTCRLTDRCGIKHELWQVSDPEFIEEAERAVEAGSALYICDGHHRVAAAAEYAGISGTEAAGRFMAAVFPTSEMRILDYNRVVRDLNGLTVPEFIGALAGAGFDVKNEGFDPITPRFHGEYTMVIAGEWYRVRSSERMNDDPSDISKDPVRSLDVSVLQEKVLAPILGITDPQNDDRLSFIKGTEGVEALGLAVESGMAAAFALYPVSMEEIIAVADAGLSMPPKSTCFSPKPLNGLVMYRI